MLQQTQASRVVNYYRRWIKKFPSFSALASGSTSSVLKEWSGLGYNSRALRIHSLARHVSTSLNNRLPREVEKLQELPGIGKYTAHAVACFSFHRHFPVVDVNIRRIITRLTTKITSIREMVDERKAWELAEYFLPSKNAYDWNQALMDLGALICSVSDPSCGECPLARECRSAFSPVFLKKEKKEKKKEPSRYGIPRRLYRGKILKLLHDRQLTLDDIAGVLWQRAKDSDRVWLEEVLMKMVSDGLIVTNRRSFRVDR